MAHLSIEQKKVFHRNALASAHTEIHRALSELDHQGSKVIAKESLKRAIANCVSVLADL